MNMPDSLNKVIEYIETHLDDEIEFARIAQIACCSQFHFQRMFAFMTDIPLSEYIRRRRLTAAAFDLKNGDKVIDVAVKYGYASADAFSRAFQAMHGLTPSAARGGAMLKAYPRLIFTITIKGVVAMNYRIEEKDSFKVVGVKQFVTTAGGENFTQIPQMWCDLPKETFMTLLGLSDREPSGVLGVCGDMNNDGFDYWIAAATTKTCPATLETLDVPACTWAIFDCVGPMPGAIQETFKRIYGEWFPASGYEKANAPEIEWYSDGDTNAPDYKSAVWVPVVKK